MLFVSSYFEWATEEQWELSLSRGEEGCTDPSSPSSSLAGLATESVEVSEAEDDPPVGLLVAEVVRQVEEPFLIRAPFPSTSSFTLSSSINLSTNQLNVSGFDWVDGIKNLTLSSQPLELSSPIPTACIEEPPSVSALEPFLLKQSHSCSPLNQMTQYISFIHVLKGLLGGWGKPLLGLLRRGDDRMSHFTKAQPRERKDLLAGKKISIERELIVVHS